MRGILTLPSEKTSVKEDGFEFLYDLRLSIKKFFKR